MSCSSVKTTVSGRKQACIVQIFGAVFVQVYPGGLLSTTYLEVVADTVTVDVLGVIEADGYGYEAGGTQFYSRLKLVDA